MLLMECDRHWGTEAVGLFAVADSPFGISSWMCGACVKVRAVPGDVERREAKAGKSTEVGNG